MFIKEKNGQITQSCKVLVILNSQGKNYKRAYHSSCWTVYWFVPWQSVKRLYWYWTPLVCVGLMWQKPDPNLRREKEPTPVSRTRDLSSMILLPRSLHFTISDYSMLFGQKIVCNLAFVWTSKSFLFLLLHSQWEGNNTSHATFFYFQKLHKNKIEKLNRLHLYLDSIGAELHFHFF